MGGILDDLQSAWNDVSNAGETVIHSIEDAVDKLVSLGVPFFAELPQLVQIITEYNENPFTLIPMLIGKINSMGSNPATVLSEVTIGIMSQGLTGYAKSVITKLTQPLIDGTHKHTQVFHSVATIHQDTLTQVKTKLTNLRLGNTGSAPMQGDFADALDTHFATVETAMTSVIGPFGIQLQDPWPWFQQNLDTINKGLVQNLENIPQEMLVAAIVTLLVCAVVGVAADGVGEIITIPAAIVLIGAEFLALVAADLLAWLLEFITLLIALGVAEAVYQGVNAWNNAFGTHTHALVPSGATLPNPDLTPEQEATAEALFNEFGGTVPREVIDYLVKMLGTGVSAALASAMIRCLYKGGYLTMNSGSVVLDSRFTSALNGLANHMDPNDLEGAWKDNNPDQVDPSTVTNPDQVSNAQHGKEVGDALQSINKVIKSLNDKINYLNMQIGKNPPNINDLQAQKSLYERLRDSFSKLSDFVSSHIKKGSPPPDTWPDKGQIPFGEDLLSTSHCNVPPYEPV